MLKSTSPGLGPDIPALEAVGGRGGGSPSSPRSKPRQPFLAQPPSRQTQGRSQGGASSRTRAVRPESQDAPALQFLRSPAEGGRRLLARPGRRSRGISPPQGRRPGHALKRRPPGAQDRGGCRGKMASRFILEGYGEKGQRGARRRLCFNHRSIPQTPNSPCI